MPQVELNKCAREQNVKNHLKKSSALYSHRIAKILSNYYIPLILNSPRLGNPALVLDLFILGALGLFNVRGMEVFSISCVLNISNISRIQGI